MVQFAPGPCRFRHPHLEAESAESPDGFVRTTVELPPGTKPEQIIEIGFECMVPEKAESDSACSVEAVTKCFFLDREYTPSTNVWEAWRRPTIFRRRKYGHPR